ncbi:SusE domain-containing protein [Leeuwenhoekiella polynyae]|uniref:SusE-like outer membrane protein n=1 Tax=Leeuwenhoekiella polynyae TaxID=1550906 RepID=A0A4Q0PF91_9FLAO|nr:SusE domain-containing protein [Leeuwenhoekiella polynyae]RXG25534.1 SusE-like outer membrane protein [Leeuwenhoekiella polynyae]
MKSAIGKILVVFALFLGLVSCEDDDSLNIAEVSEVEALYSPENNVFYNLGAQSAAIFEWQASKSADNGVVLYDVVFDEEGGDFSEPLYVTPSDGQGFSNKLNLSFTRLNEIATMAGIASESTGKLQWTVWSSKGLNVKQSSEIRTIEVERPAGFPTPDELFLTGAASEGGEDLAAAMPFVKTGATTYEIYTKLKPGTYKMVTRNSGEPESFYIDSESKLKKDGETTFSGTEAVYRIRLDFSDGTTSMATIDKVELWFPPNGDYLFSLDYAGNGTWEALDKYIEFKEETWGRDERYKFKFTVTTESGTLEEWYGSVNVDNSQAPTLDTADSFYYMVPQSPGEDYNYTFKFRQEVDMANVDLKIYFNADVPEYTHEITVL